MLSKITCALCTLVMLYASFIFYPRWNAFSKTEATISWDVSGYYWYLPSLFIYKDIRHQGFKDEILQKYQPTGGNDFQQAFMHPSGNYVMKYSSGMAVMYFPFFITAHVLAKPLGYPPDGFSPPYQFAIQAGGLLVALIGLWFLRKFLLIFYTDVVVAITLLLLVLGTNFLNYGAIDTGMSHGWLFTVYVFLLWATYRFYRRPSFKHAITIGLLCGLATLTRPTDIISTLIPVLWGLESLSLPAIKKQYDFLKRNIKYLGVAFVCAALVFSIQLIYWKYATGEWLVYSYQEQGFDWLHPHFKKYMISAHNGWLAYNPIWFLAFFGFITYWKRKPHRIAVLLFILLDLYIVVCWEFFHHGGRFMVQAYPLLLLPLASFVEWAISSRIWKIVFVPVAALCVYIGLWTNIQYHRGNLYDWDTGNRAYYLATIGRWSVPDDVFKLRDDDEQYMGTPIHSEVVYQNDFESDTTACTEPPIAGNRSICLTASKTGYDFRFPYAQHNNKWIRAEATFHCVNKEWNVWNMSQFIISFLNNGKDVKTKILRVYRLLNDGDTKRISMDAIIPKEQFNEVKIGFWHAESKQTLVIDDLKVVVFKGE